MNLGILRFWGALGLMVIISSNGFCQDKTAEAKAAFDSGVDAFNKGSYLDAAEAFRQANRLKPTWALLFNIGQSEAAARRYGLAYEAFEEYISKGGDDISETRRETVLKEMDRLQRLIGSVFVSAPDGAKVTMDGAERGTAPLPTRLKTAIGVLHTIEIRMNDELLLSRSFKVSQGENLRIEAPAKRTTQAPGEPTAAPAEEVESTPEPASAEPTPPPEASTKTARAKRIGWITIGIGGASLIGGAATGGVALSMNAKLKDVCTDGVCPEGERDRSDTRKALALSSDILLSTGAVVAGVGLGFLIWFIASKSKGERPTTARVIPLVGGPTVLGVAGRF